MCLAGVSHAGFAGVGSSGCLPAHGWAAGEVSTSPDGDGILGVDLHSIEPDALGVLSKRAGRFVCENVVTSLKHAAAWAPWRSVYAAFGEPEPSGARRVLLFGPDAKVSMRSQLGCRLASLLQSLHASSSLRLPSAACNCRCTPAAAFKLEPLFHASAPTLKLASAQVQARSDLLQGCSSLHWHPLSLELLAVPCIDQVVILHPR